MILSKSYQKSRAYLLKEMCFPCSLKASNSFFLNVLLVKVICFVLFKFQFKRAQSEKWIYSMISSKSSRRISIFSLCSSLQSTDLLPSFKGFRCFFLCSNLVQEFSSIKAKVELKHILKGSLEKSLNRPFSEAMHGITHFLGNLLFVTGNEVPKSLLQDRKHVFLG